MPVKGTYEYQRKISRAQKSSEQLHASQPERFPPLNSPVMKSLWIRAFLVR